MSGQLVYTVMCHKFGCLWQGSSYDRAEAQRWGEEHTHDGGYVEIYEEVDR